MQYRNIGYRNIGISPILRAILIPILNEAISLISILTVIISVLNLLSTVYHAVTWLLTPVQVTVPDRPILAYIITCACVPDCRAAIHFPAPHESWEKRLAAYRLLAALYSDRAMMWPLSLQLCKTAASWMMSHDYRAVMGKSQIKSQVAKSTHFTQKFKSINPNLKSNHNFFKSNLQTLKSQIFFQITNTT